ncbi:2-dehydropantoate 2-reductase [bacterium]|nr:2-dehydropantoate 2-reductase [bacterium]
MLYPVELWVRTGVSYLRWFAKKASAKSLGQGRHWHYVGRMSERILDICVVGAGAVGGYIAAKMALNGHRVSVLGRRGAHLQAMQRQGLELTIANGKTVQAPIHAASDRAEELPKADYVLLGVKSHLIPDIAPSLLPLFKPDTAVSSIVNGIPWWYGYGVQPAWNQPWLDSVDPGGRIWKTLGPERAIGCVTNIASSIERPGHIHVGFESWYRFGEPAAPTSARLETLVNAMTAAGIDAQAKADIRAEVWHKVWGNAAYNPVSVITRAPMNRIATDPNTRPIIIGIMEEIRLVAESMGITALTNLEERLSVAEKLGAHKTSMLQDWEKDATLELETILGAVVELAKRHRLATPRLDMLYGLMRQKIDIRQEAKEQDHAMAHA